MTDYSALPAREIDALVAREVMGWTEISPSNFNDEPDFPRGFQPGDNRDRKTIGAHFYWTLNVAVTIPRYSTDGSAMLAVLDALANKGWIVGTWRHPARDDVTVLLSRPDGRNRRHDITGSTLPRAVAEAALAAVGGK